MVEWKSVSPTIKKLDDQGRGVAVIATLNTIDKDMDVTRPGAFGNDQVAPMVPAHNWEHVPIGKGRIFESGNEVLYDFQMNMKIDQARAWYEALKFDMENPPPKQEWSYGYSARRVPGQHDGREVEFLNAIRVHEVSPVIVGAGTNTRTLAVKQDQNLAARTRAAVAQYEIARARWRGVLPAGDFAWKVSIVPGWDGLLLRSMEYAVLAAKELGVSTPRPFLFSYAGGPARADFYTDRLVAGVYLAARPNEIGINAGIASPEWLAEVVAHECHHAGRPGAGEAAADEFGRDFARRHAKGDHRMQGAGAAIDLLADVCRLARLHGWSGRELKAVIAQL
jgi:hypothetical protein